jgi:hypothetical protein
MAGSTAFPFSFYRLTGGGDTEVSIANAEAQGFDYGINEDSEIGVVGFNFGAPQRPTDVPNVGERSSSHPSTSIVSVPINIDFVVNEKISAFPKSIAKFLKWSLEDQTVRGTYTHGRFALRNDKMGSLPTLLPTADVGIKFIDFNVTDEIEWSDHQTGTIKLELVGDYTALIALLTTIIGA